MRHHKIPKSGRHKKLKVVSASNYSDDEEDNHQPKGNTISGNPSKARAIEKLKRKVSDKDKLKKQKIPRKQLELFNFKKEPRKRTKKTSEPGMLEAFNKHQFEEDTAGAERGVKLQQNLVKQGLYESDDLYMRRLNRLAANAKSEAAIESHFDIDLCPKLKPQVLSTVDGSILDFSKKKKVEEEPVVSKKKEKRRLYDQKRKMKKRKIKPTEEEESDGIDFDDYVDNVEFGEVASRPPSLPKWRKRNKV